MSTKDGLDRRKLMHWARPDPDHGNVVGMLATTYDLDATFFDSDYLPTFLGLGAWEDTSWSNRVAMQRALARTEAAVVMVDARRFRGRPRSLHIEVTPAVGPSGAKLHAKILLVIQERAVRLLVGSANLTDSGYRYNREVGLPIVATAQTPKLAALVSTALADMQETLQPWWTPAADRIHTLALETMVGWKKPQDDENQFVWSWGTKSLATQFTDWWPNEKISGVTIISPFWTDEGEDGPVQKLLAQLGLERVSGARIRLLTEAAAETQSAYRPALPAALAAWDARQLNVRGEIQAIDPRVLPEEVGGRTDYQPLRPLHAKIVVVEGPKTTLAYIGSANFTQHGWGYVGARSNIEAGVIMRRQGKDRQDLVGLIPSVTGARIPLNGKGQSAVTVVQRGDGDPAWPTFIRDIRLVPIGIGKKELELCVTLNTPKLSGSFSVWVADHSNSVLLDSSRLATGPLEPQVLEQLLRSQRVRVSWDAYSVEFPINVDLEARLLLPVGPGSAPPGEKLLLQYYQGRIAAEDIYPPPPGESDVLPEPVIPNNGSESGVDTSRIQSYQIREFVEALQGIHDDLRSASQATEAAMKQAVRGELSPTTLAHEVVRAAHDKGRSATAAGFQLVEILACLAKAEHFDVSPKHKTVWVDCLGRAREEIMSLLSALIVWGGGELQLGSAFNRYHTAILKRRTQT
jgi:hypothetical protein